MEYRKFNSTVFIRMDPGEEVLEQLMDVCVKEKIHLAKVEALGAVSRFTVGLYDVNEKKYHSNEFVFSSRNCFIDRYCNREGRSTVSSHSYECGR